MPSRKKQAEAEFDEWWDSVGSGMPNRPDEEMEAHAKRVSKQAWQDAITTYIYQHED